MFPTFKITEIVKNPNGLELEGNISSVFHKSDKWIDNDWLGFLRNEDLMIYGRWKENNDKWKFLIKPEDILKSNLRVGNELTVFDGYWGERVEIVIDKNIDWQESTCTIKDDHDHCAICWKTVSEFENQKFMLGDNRIKVCLECYEQFIKPSNLDFIVNTNKGQKLCV